MLKMLVTSAKGAQPRGAEAQRVLTFFISSLKNPTLVRKDPGAGPWGQRPATLCGAHDNASGTLCSDRPGPAQHHHQRQHQRQSPSRSASHLALLRRPQETPPAVDDMLSWNVLTPHYEEDVVYALNAQQASCARGAAQRQAAQRSAA